MDHSLLPGPGDIAAYREHGFWISPVIVPAAVLDAAERGMRRFYAGERDTELAELGELGGWTRADGPGLRKNDYASLVVSELAELVAYPAIAACAARLAGAATIRLWHDQLLYKPADASGVAANVGWHTDRQYWLSCASEEMLTAWIAFHDVDERGGSVSFLEGSHRWDVDGLDFFGQDLDLLARRMSQQGFAARVRPTAMRRGQVSFHHCRTVHGSGPNRGTEPRRSLVQARQRRGERLPLGRWQTCRPPRPRHLRHQPA